MVDWGMSRPGPRWSDVFCFALEWVEKPSFDEIVGTLDLATQGEADFTGFLAGIGCWLLIKTTEPPHPSLPTLPAFRRALGSRCLVGVRRRLDGGLGLSSHPS